MKDFENLKELTDYCEEVLTDIGFVSVIFADQANMDDLKAKDFPRCVFYPASKVNNETFTTLSLIFVAVDVAEAKIKNYEQEVMSRLEAYTTKFVNKLRKDNHIEPAFAPNWTAVSKEGFNGLSGWSTTIDFIILNQC